MTIHHIGIIVNNMNEAVKLYEKFGYKLTKGIVWDSIQNNQIAILESDFSLNIELIHAIDKTSSVYNFKEGYHHICYEAEPHEDVIQNFKSINIGKIFTKPTIAPALGNREVVFACLQNGTFVELII